jgi:hypothetical protein
MRVTIIKLYTTLHYSGMRSSFAEKDWWRITQPSSHYGGLHWYFSERDTFNVILFMPALSNENWIGKGQPPANIFLGEIAISPEKIAHHHPVLAKLLYHQKKLPKLLYHQKKLPKLLYHQKLLPKLLYHQKQLQYHQKKPIAPPKLQHHHRNARKLLPPPKNAIHPSKIVCTLPDHHLPAVPVVTTAVALKSSSVMQQRKLRNPYFLIELFPYRSL